MKEILKSYKYRMKPNEEQKVLLNKHFGVCRFLYNYFLNQKKTQYKETSKSDNYKKQAKSLTELKKQPEYIWLKEVNSQSQQAALKNLDAAYQRFFNHISDYPKFKKKKNKNSFNIPQCVTIIDEDKVCIPKFKEGIKFVNHKPFIGQIRNATISKDACGNYFVSFLVCVHYESYEPTGKSVGVDLGIKDLAITSDGIKYENLKFFNKYKSKLAKAQRRLNKKQKGSNQYEKQKLVVAKIHRKISNSRKDNLHKITTDLVKNYDLIVVENLKVKNMLKNRKLARHISDCAWGTFISYLEYKARWNDKQVVKIGTFFPSSKTCSQCGRINKELELSDRKWVCKSCGCVHDRDLNASINILNEGIRILNSVGTTDYANGGVINPEDSLVDSNEVRSP